MTSWVKNAAVAFLAALQFLTIAPVPVRRMLSPRDMGRSVAFFPVVGLLLGGLLFGLSEALTNIWPSTIAAALVIVAWVLATGALHLDGFLDACDGLFGGATPERRLQIMRDERVGAFAAIGCTMLLLTKYATLAMMENRVEAYLLAPMVGRWGMVLAIVCFPYGRPEGLGRSMKDNAGWTEVVCATVVTAAACALIGAERGLCALALAGAGTWLAARFALQRLPGLTGDIYGAICEVLEVVTLLLWTARVPL